MKTKLTITLLLCLMPISALAQDRIVVQLKTVAQGLTYQSETDSPVYVFQLSSRDAEAFLKRVHDNDPTHGPAFTFDEFAKGQATYQDWYGLEEKRMADGFGRLFTLMTENLRDLKIRYVGCEPVYQLYIFGRDASGNIVGVRMKVVSS